jgi:hypothetical protein
MFLVVNTAIMPLILAGLWLMMIANSIINGAQPAMLTQIFPTGIRYSGSSICSQIGSSVGGGIVPLLSAAAYARFGTSTAVGLLIAAACAVSMLAALPVSWRLLDVGADAPTSAEVNQPAETG